MVVNVTETSAGTIITVAAEFEDCMQTCQSLCAAIETIWPDKTLSVRGIRRLLQQWGYRSGAATRALDYDLRKSSELRDQLLDLLEGLNATFHSALEIVQMAAMPMLSPAILDNTQASYFDRRPDDRHGIGTFTVTEADLQAKLEDSRHTLGLLDRLSPALANPPPLDLFQTSMNDDSIESEVKLVSRLFPKASKSLALRFGEANWQRRYFLRSLRTRLRKEISSVHQMASTPGSNRQLSFASTQSLPRQHSSFRPVFPQHHRSILGRLNSRRTSFSDSGTNDSGFWSKADSRTAETATSVADADCERSSQLGVPPPPIPLEIGATFRCQHCGLLIVVGETCSELRQRWLEQSEGSGDGLFTTPSLATGSSAPSNPEADITLPTKLEVLTSADWVSHVFADIEPYICTWEHCGNGCRTYGSIMEWLKHELEAHRLTRVWHCQLCVESFSHSEGFVKHLTATHDTSPEQAWTLLGFSERLSVDPPNLGCTLCGFPCTSVGSYRTHVSGHLEQLALSSIDADGKLEDEAPMSPKPQPASADYARLEEFVFSQSKFYPNTVFQQHSTSDGAAINTAKASNQKQSKRPAMQVRGLSYTFMSKARKQRAGEGDNGASVATTPSGAFPTRPKTIRTNAPPRNSDFIGRITDMDTIHRELSRPGTVCVLSGVGGLGKSALAAEYTYRFEVAFTHIFWVQAETPMVCADTFTQIAVTATRLTSTEISSTNEQRLVSLSQEFLETSRDRWLMVLDNVDEKLDLRRFLPLNMATASGSVLITTNKDDIGLAGLPFSVTQINLAALTLEESRRLLLSATPDWRGSDAQHHPEYKLAGQIAKRAERLPLALSLIAGYVIVSQCTLADFVDLWNERRSNVRSSSHPALDTSSNADDTMEALWDIGLREVTSDARKLLNILAFLDPDYIQKELLVGQHEDPMLELLHVSEAGRFRRMTSELKRRRLIAVELKDGEQVMSVHRKLQARLLRELAKDESSGRLVFSQAFTLVRSRFPTASPIQVPEPEKWQTCKKYLPHVLSIQRLMLGKWINVEPSVELAQLFSDGGIDLWERGLTMEGLHLMKSAEAVLDQISSYQFQLLRASIHVIISLLLQDSGLVHIGECRDRINSALEIRQRYREECSAETYSRNDEILLYNAWSDYGCVLLQLNLFEDAELIFDRCLRKYTEWGDPDAIPYEYAKGHHHIAFCLMHRGSADESISHAGRSLRYVERATGKSAAYYRWKFDLACLLFQHPNFLESSTWQSRTIEMHREVLEARLHLHGGSAFLTLESYYAVGAVMSCLGNLPEAESCFRTILDVEKARPGSCNELALARTQYHLGQLLLGLEEGSQASQNPTSRSEAETTTASAVNAADQTQEERSLLSVTKPIRPRRSNPALRPSSSMASPSARTSAGQAPKSPVVVLSTGPSLKTMMPDSSTDHRLQEASDLTVAAEKILDKHRSQAAGFFAQIAAGEQDAAAQNFIAENPIVLYDLMQPVFDGRLAGRDAMEYLRLTKKNVTGGDKPLTAAREESAITGERSVVHEEWQEREKRIGELLKALDL